LSTEQVRKYFEVRLFSLVLVAAVVFIICLFFLFLFVWRKQYVYAGAVVPVAVILAVSAVKVWRYAGMYKRV
jgi:hypothetical protein